MSISGRLTASGSGNDRTLRSGFRRLSNAAATWPALFVPRDELNTNVENGGRLPSAMVSSKSTAFKSSWVFPSPT